MSSISSFAQAQAVLNQFVPQKPQSTGYTLDNITAFMNYLDNPQNKLKVIHVAGTSGKTSTAYYVASLLNSAGYTTGLTVSPHIDQVNERAQIDLKPLPEADYCRELSEFLKLVINSQIDLSYFEVLVAFSYWLFNKRGVEYAVIEVGLGGLLDGTNVVNRADKVCIITDIGLDHTTILGNTLEKIAFQKAGIITPSNNVFINEQPSEVVAVIADVSQRSRATLHVLEDDVKQNDIAVFKLPLFQQRNFALALAAVNFVCERDHRTKISTKQIQQATKIYIPGRMEVMKYNDKTLILDGSHNEQKISALVKSIEEQFPKSTITLLVSFGSNKGPSVAESLKLLRKLGSKIIITQFVSRQDEIRVPIDPDQLAIGAKVAGFEDITIEPNSAKALEMLVQDSSDVGLVTGSFYVLNSIREIVFVDTE